MHMVRHLCGCELERGAGRQGDYFQRIAIDDARITLQATTACPLCREPLCDTDMSELSGAPLVVDTPSSWSIGRRAALAGLAQAGYTLRYEAGLWRIRAADQDYDTASSDNLDAVIELAAAIAAGRRP